MGGWDKLFAPIAARPLLLHSLRAFDESPAIASIVIAASKANIGRVRRLTREGGIRKVVSIVEGGARRQDSVASALGELDAAEIVLVHDGARPFVTDRIISSAAREAAERHAAAAAVPVKDTIKIAAPDMTVASTPPRDTLWAAQTPQAFAAPLLRSVHAQIDHDVTDDAGMVEAAGHPVKLFMGDYANIKITTPEDLTLAQAIALARLREDRA